MCLPHGFVVTDPIAPSQSMLLLVSMFVLCWKPNMVRALCTFSIYSLSPPWGFSSLKSRSYPQVRFPLGCLFSPPLCLCPYAVFPLLIYSLVLTWSYPQWFFNTAVYGPEHRRVHRHLWPPRWICLFCLLSDALTMFLFFPLSSLRVWRRSIVLPLKTGPLAWAQTASSAEWFWHPR